MGYISKDNTTIIGEDLKLAYIKNEDGKTCNPTIFMFTKLDLSTNQFSAPRFSVSFYENKDTKGYLHQEFTTYAEALEVFEAQMAKYHVG